MCCMDWSYFTAKPSYWQTTTTTITNITSIIDKKSQAIGSLICLYEAEINWMATSATRIMSTRTDRLDEFRCDAQVAVELSQLASWPILSM